MYRSQRTPVLNFLFSRLLRANEVHPVQGHSITYDVAHLVGRSHMSLLDTLLVCIDKLDRHESRVNTVLYQIRVVSLPDHMNTRFRLV